jgi:hypothetical protein
MLQMHSPLAIVVVQLSAQTRRRLGMVAGNDV